MSLPLTPIMKKSLTTVAEYQKAHPDLTLNTVLKNNKISTSTYYAAIHRTQEAGKTSRKKPRKSPAKKYTAKTVTLPASFLMPLGNEAAPTPTGKVIAFVGDPHSIAELVKSLI